MNTVGDWMTSDPKTIEPGAPALAALELMIDEGIRHLPVVDRGARLVGILSVDDLRAALPFAVSIRRPPALEERESAREISVGETMTHGPLTTTAKTSVGDAAALLARFRIGCLPVVEAGRLVGILSETDVLRSIAGQDAKRVRPHGDLRAVDLKQLVAELGAERNRILRRLGRTQEADRGMTEEEREIPMDRVEQAAHRIQLNVDEPLSELSSRRLEAIEHALERAAKGSLGKCEKCGRAIPVARLRAVPGTVFCVRHAGEAS
jgi:acetoin utilization protein AcuB